MPKILQLKAGEIPGTMWALLEVPGPQGSLSILSQEEIKRINYGELEIIRGMFDEIVNKRIEELRSRK